MNNKMSKSSLTRRTVLSGAAAIGLSGSNPANFTIGTNSCTTAPPPASASRLSGKA